MRPIAGATVAAFMSALSISAMLPVDALAQSRAEKTEGQLETVEDVAGLTDLSFDELRGKDLSGVNDAMMRPAPSAVRQPRTRAQREAGTIAGLTGGRGVRSHTVIADTLNRDAAAQTFAGEREFNAAVDKANSYSFGDKFAAAFEDTTITAAIFRQFDREVEDYDLNWARDYARDRTSREQGYAWDEVRRLRRANSQADFDRIAGEIAEGRERKAVYMSGGSGKWYSIFVHALDPVVWLALAALLSASIFAGRCRRRLKVPSGN